MTHARVHHRRAGPQGTRHPRRSRRGTDHRCAGRDLRVRPSCFRRHRQPATSRPTAPSCTSNPSRPFNDGHARRLRRGARPQRRRDLAWSLSARARRRAAATRRRRGLRARPVAACASSWPTDEVVGTVEEIYELPQGLALDVRRAPPRETGDRAAAVRRPHHRVRGSRRRASSSSRRPKGCSSEDQRRHDLPRVLRRAARAEHSGARRGGRARDVHASSTCATTRTTVIARSTTLRTAAGAGMVMKPEPFFEAVDALGADGADRAR